jgi:hypothetical protein
MATLWLKLRIRPAERFALALGLLACMAPAAGIAIVGPAREDASLLNRVVMVLIRGAGKAGFCSGVALAPRVILTAAHCVRPIQDMRVFYRNASGGDVFAEVAATAINPGYRADSVGRRVPSVDLALVETAEPLDGRFSAPEIDQTGELAIDQTVLVAGFGVGREAEQQTAGTLRSARLAIRAPVSKILLWAADPNGGGLGACVGDSGGPVFSDGGALVAIVAWASGGRGQHCGALTQAILVAPHLLWIRSKLESWQK